MNISTGLKTAGGLLAAGIVLRTIPAGPAPAYPESGRPFAVTNVRVFDGEKILPGATVTVRDGKIVSVDPALAPFLKPEDAAGLNAGMGFKTSKEAYGAAEDALRQLHEAGASILAGTDAPNPGTVWGASLHGELELLVKAGLSPIEALRAATSVPADHFGIANRGRIRAAKAADLVLIDGDPAADIRMTRRISAVWKDGVWHEWQ